MLPDLILLDVMMPGLSGYEVCMLLKQGASTANIPVIFITSLDAGAVDYVTKPINANSVAAADAALYKAKASGLNRVATHEMTGIRSHAEPLYGHRLLGYLVPAFRAGIG